MASKNIEPQKINLDELLKKDRKFLLAMIDNPKDAFNKQRIRIDNKSISSMNAAADRLRMQAIAAFSDIAKDGLNNCYNCKGFASGDATSPM